MLPLRLYLLAATLHSAMSQSGPVCTILNPVLPQALGCSCTDNAETGVGGSSTCTMSTPAINIPNPLGETAGAVAGAAADTADNVGNAVGGAIGGVMGGASPPPSPSPQAAASGGTGNILEIPSITFELGAEVLPCGDPVSAKAHATVTMPSNLPEEITSLLNGLSASDGSITVTLGSENTVAIEKSVEAGKEETIDVPFFTGAIASANFRIILTVNGNVDSLTLELAADMCLKLNEMELCGGLIPTCTDADDFSSLGDQANVAIGLRNTFCTVSGNFNANEAFGSPPYEFLQLSAVSFAGVCPTPGATVVVNVITFKATIAGTVDSFDEEAFKTNLASGLDGIESTDITVSAAPGSVVVTSEIVTSDAAVAGSTMAFLAAADETSLTDLLQVTVTAVEPPSQTSSVSSSGGGPGGILAGIFGTLVALAAIAAVYVFFKKAKKKIEPQPQAEAPAAEDAETPPN